MSFSIQRSQFIPVEKLCCTFYLLYMYTCVSIFLFNFTFLLFCHVIFLVYVFIDSSSCLFSLKLFFPLFLPQVRLWNLKPVTMHKRITSRILRTLSTTSVIYLTGFNQEPSLPLVIHLCQVQQFKEKYNHLSSINCLFFWRQRRDGTK